jgi:hypothetical protein
MAVGMKIRAFWDIAPCSLGVDWYFRGTYCLQHDHPDVGGKYAPLKHGSIPARLHGAISQKAPIFMYIIVL